MHCHLRTARHSSSGSQTRSPAASCSYTVRPQRSLCLSARQRGRTVCVKAAAKTLYEALGVSQDANDRDIKRAYRQKALKLHPDVNKAPNAEAQFLEVKNAFQVLSDPQQRAQYDRKLKGGFGDFSGWGSSAPGGGFGGYGSWGTSGGSSSGSRPKQQDEEFYGLDDLLSEVGRNMNAWVQQGQQELSKLQQGAEELPGWLGGVAQQAGEAIKTGRFEDFFNDLEKEVDAWSKKRASSGKPASLWEELAAIGEEFVDFLEQGLKEEPSGSSSSSSSSKASSSSGAGKEGSSSGGSSSFNSATSSSGARRSPVDMYEELKRQYDLGGNKSSSSGAGSSTGRAAPPPPPPPPPKKSADEEIDDMLAALKKKMNKA